MRILQRITNWVLATIVIGAWLSFIYGAVLGTYGSTFDAWFLLTVFIPFMGVSLIKGWIP